VATRRRAASKTMTGAVSDLQRRVRYLQASTPPSRLATQVVARTNVRPRAINSDQIELAAVTNDQIAADAVKLSNMGTNSVGEGQIVDGSVSNGKLAEDSVSGDKIQIDAITTSKVNNSAITTAKLANSSVNDSKITSNAVTEEKIRNGAVGRSKLQNNSVGRDQIDSRAVGTAQIADSAVGSGQIAGGAVGSGQLGNGSVTRAKIGSGSVGTTQLATGAVTGDRIADNTILLRNLNGLTPIGIVNNGLQAGLGMQKGGGGNQDITLSVNFGGGSTQVPRGNHFHNLNMNNALTGSNEHRHTGRTYGAVSTVASKKDITTYSPQNIKNLLELQPKQYKYKRANRAAQEDQNREWMHGYLIEDLETLGFTEPIAYNSKGEPERLDYSLMSVLVLELVKTQQTEIDSLREEINKMKDKK